MKGQILWLLAGLLIVLFVNSNIIWFFERRKNSEAFLQQYFAGVWEAIWWSVCTIITGGCENIAPRGAAVRLTAIIWMLAGAALFTYITATITSAMTVETFNSDVQSVSDLKTKKWAVATLAGSTAQAFLERQGLTLQTFSDVDTACAALDDDKVRAVVYDAPMLRYYAKNNPDKQLGVVGELFEKQRYGIAVPQGSAYRKRDHARDSGAARAGLLRGVGEQIFRREYEQRQHGRRSLGASRHRSDNCSRRTSKRFADGPTPVANCTCRASRSGAL